MTFKDIKTCLICNKQLNHTAAEVISCRNWVYGYHFFGYLGNQLEFLFNDKYNLLFNIEKNILIIRDWEGKKEIKIMRNISLEKCLLYMKNILVLE